MPQRFDSVFDEDVEEEEGPGSIVGNVESRPEQSHKADEALDRYGALNRVHFSTAGEVPGVEWGE